MPRFSKNTLAEYVFSRIDRIQKEHHFDPDNGWSQVYDKGEEVNRAYGEYDELTTMASNFGLVHPGDRKS